MSLAIAEGLKLPKGSRFSIGAVPAAIAGVAPTLDFRPALERREIEAVSLTDKLTFTGGNQGTFVGSDGYIQRAQTNVPRFTHDPVTRRSLGMLLEASGENLLLRSEQFETGWANTGVAITANQAVSPYGTLSAYLLETSLLNEGHNIAQSIAWTAATYTTTVYAKYIDHQWISFRVGASGNQRWATFDLLNNVVGAATSGVTHGISNEGGGWYRLIMITQLTTAGTAGLLIVLNNANDLNNNAYTGTGTGAYLLGAQINTGPLTSYIPTTTAAVTRTADSAVIDGAGVITGTYTMVEKPEGCAVISGTNINLQNGFTVERVMIFPATLTAGQITAIRAAM